VVETKIINFFLRILDDDISIGVCFAIR